MIQGMWFLMEIRRGLGRRMESYLGLYLACHINGPAEFPIQYAHSMIAFTVILFVWPEVTFESQDSERTKPVVPIPIKKISNAGI